MNDLVFDYRKPAELTGGSGARHPVIVVGAGPVGLCAALDLSRRGIPVLLLDEGAELSAGSRAICFAKRTLEILDLLGVGDEAVDRGVTWNRGKVFLGESLLYAFDLLPDCAHKRPAFINLQQYHLERILIERLQRIESAQLRWRNRVLRVEPEDSHVTVAVDTPDGAYRLECEYLIAADGVRSTVRQSLGLEMAGQVFRDRFLIADVKMKAGFPAERWFWFDPPFNRGGSVLLHRQADDVWRIDFQLEADCDPEFEQQPERVRARLRAMLGERPFNLEWVSVYSFRCQRLEKFRHGRVLFAGDAAHQVSPFGARGANGGIQDADNLIWKLALVLGGQSSESLLDSYDAERIPAADENILHSTRSTEFITPKSRASRIFRDAALQLARTHPFARGLVNSGRLSTPHVYRTSPLSTADREDFAGAMKLGAAALDVPLRSSGGTAWLLDRIGSGFTHVHYGTVWPFEQNAAATLRTLLLVTPRGTRLKGNDWVEDGEGLFAARYDARPGSSYLFRPDQHLAARWRNSAPEHLSAALARAMGQTRMLAAA